MHRLYMSRTERYTNALRITKRLHELADAHKWSAGHFSKAVGLVDEATPITLHLMAFEPVIRAQASTAFLERYEALVTHRGLLGCYLQTELGHGSNVAGLETTATYLRETHEFEIHSPNLTSSKWWIGSAGKTATHGVVQAQLILPGGKNMGPHLFFVQLRSLDNHKPLPGITIGDIGMTGVLFRKTL